MIIVCISRIIQDFSVLCKDILNYYDSASLVTSERRIWNIAGIVLTEEKQVVENIFVLKPFCPAQIQHGII